LQDICNDTLKPIHYDSCVYIRSPPKGNTKGEAELRGTNPKRLEPLEGQLVLNIKGDGLGHFEVECATTDKPGNGGTLSFSLSFDQTELPRLINELDKITKAFPIKGDFNIKNE